MKTVADFYPDRRYRQGVGRTCRACVRQNNAKRDKATMAFNTRVYNAKQDPVKRALSYRRFNLMRWYGLTMEDYERMVVEQDGLCAICHRPETMKCRNGKIRSLAVDHDASTGKVRGLLCGRCNVAIGYLSHDLELLQAAFTYLRQALDSAAKPPLLPPAPPAPPAA